MESDVLGNPDGLPANCARHMRAVAVAVDAVLAVTDEVNQRPHPPGILLVRGSDALRNSDHNLHACAQTGRGRKRFRRACVCISYDTSG
jgi:hypothetical protein